MRGVAWRRDQIRSEERWCCPTPEPSDRTKEVGLASPSSTWQRTLGLELPPAPYLLLSHVSGGLSTELAPCPVGEG